MVVERAKATEAEKAKAKEDVAKVKAAEREAAKEERRAARANDRRRLRAVGDALCGQRRHLLRYLLLR